MKSLFKEFYGTAKNSAGRQKHLRACLLNANELELAAFAYALQEFQKREGVQPQELKEIYEDLKELQQKERAA